MKRKFVGRVCAAVAASTILLVGAVPGTAFSQDDKQCETVVKDGSKFVVCK